MRNASQDPCYRSISFLKELCIQSCSDHQLQNPIFADDDSFFFQKHKEYNDIFLFGDFQNKILKSFSWTGKKYRFWVLSHSVKQIMIKIFNIPSEFINIVPIQKSRSKKNTNLYSKFIYAGRIIEEKNISLLIKVIHELKKNIPHIHLVIKGSFSKETMNGKTQVDYKKRIKKLVKDLNLEDSVSFSPFSNDHNWQEKYLTDYNFISLSTAIYEDFGVSAYHFLKSNGKIILSNWNGHKEFRGNGIIKIEMNNELFKNDLVESLNAQYIAKQILNHNDISEKTVSNSIEKSYIYKTKLDEKIYKLYEKYTPEIYFLLEKKDYEFYFSHQGRKFYNKIISILGNPVKQIISFEEKKLIENSFLTASSYFSYLPTSQLFKSAEYKKSLKANRIILSRDNPLFNKLAKLPISLPLQIEGEIKA